VTARLRQWKRQQPAERGPAGLLLKRCRIHGEARWERERADSGLVVMVVVKGCGRWEPAVVVVAVVVGVRSSIYNLQYRGGQHYFAGRALPIHTPALHRTLYRSFMALDYLPLLAACRSLDRWPAAEPSLCASLRRPHQTAKNPRRRKQHPWGEAHMILRCRPCAARLHFQNDVESGYHESLLRPSHGTRRRQQQECRAREAGGRL
jgi:hypothetical protein